MPPAATRSRRPRRRRRRAPAVLLAIALAAAIVTVVALTTGGGGSGGGRGASGGSPVDPMIDGLKRRYPRIQRDNGHYRSSVGGGTRYGDAYLGYALLQSGLRANDARAIESGVLGLARALPRAEAHSRPSVFENLALAAGYNLMRRHMAGDPTFRRLRGHWESFLRRCELIRIPAETHFGNHWLIEAVEIQELLRTGLRSSLPTAVLGGQRREATRLSSQLINVRIPAMARAESVPAPGGRAFVLSDPPDNPLAYQGLSLGFYARGVELLGRDATPLARRTLVETARASLYLTAPDGDAAYFGRNQEEAWGLAGTAYGAYAAAALHESRPAEDDRFRALAERVLRRLALEYGTGHWGLNITPSLARSRWIPPQGLDSGAGGPSFGGLVMTLLEWSRPHAQRPSSGAAIPADDRMRIKLSHSESRFAVIRRGPVWAAIRPTISGKYPYDVRYDFGVVAMKVRTGDRWVDAMRLRPFTAAQSDSAGPVLRTGGGTAFPFASDVGVEPDGTVVMRGGWRREPTRVKRVVATLPNGGKVRGLDSTPGTPVRTGVIFRFEPQPCGIGLTFPVRAGDSIEYSAFMLPERLRATPRQIDDSVSRVTFSRPGAVSEQEGYASGVDPALVRVRESFRSLAAGPMSVTHCLRPSPIRREPVAFPPTRG